MVPKCGTIHTIALEIAVTLVYIALKAQVLTNVPIAQLEPTQLLVLGRAQIVQVVNFKAVLVNPVAKVVQLVNILALVLDPVRTVRLVDSKMKQVNHHAKVVL